MTDALLGVIAVGVALMAIMQVVALVYVARAAGRADRLIQGMAEDVRPIIADVRGVVADAAKTASAALAQVGRAERQIADLGSKLEGAFGQLETKVMAPMREGTALLVGIRAAIAAFSAQGRKRDKSPPSDEEDDPLFVG
jgi:hypothetical protein